MAIGKFNITKIEVGVQYVPSSGEGDVTTGFTYGQTASNLTYYDSASSGTQASTSPGPAWIKSADYVDPNIFDMGSIAIGKSGNIKGISEEISKRNTYTSVGTYYDGSNTENKFNTNIILDLNADSNNITTNIKYYPFIDITFTLSEGTGKLFTSSDDWTFKEVQKGSGPSGEDRYISTSASGYSYNLPGYYLRPNILDNNGNTLAITEKDLNSHYYIRVYDSSNNVNWFRYNSDVLSSTSSSGFGNIFGIIENLFDSLEISAYNNAIAFGYNSATNSSHDSFQIMSSVTSTGNNDDSTISISKIKVRCYVKQNYNIIPLPVQEYTSKAHNDVSFNIALSNVMNDSAPSSTSNHIMNVTFRLSRDQKIAPNVLKHNISLESDLYDSYNAVKLRKPDASSTTAFTLKDISLDPYINYINNKEEKEETNDTIFSLSSYGNILTNIYNDTTPDVSNVYKYYLYYKVSISDINDIETLKLKLFPTISITASNESEFAKDSVKFSYYYMPEGVKQLNQKTVSPQESETAGAKIVTNEMWGYPIGETGIISNSNYFLNILNDFTDNAAWGDLIKYHCNMYHELAGGTTGISFLDMLDEIYDSSEYPIIVNGICNELIDAIKTNENLLGTNIPTLINVKYTTLAGAKHSIWYLINMIIDFRGIRESLNSEAKNDLKLLKDSDFLKSGFWRGAFKKKDELTDLYPFNLDYKVDDNIGNKIMSPIDIINRDLYIFNTNIKAVNADGDESRFPHYINNYIAYLDMFNITNADSDVSVIQSKYFGDSLIGILNDAKTANFLAPGEYEYLSTNGASTSFFRSIFDDDCPVNSYDLYVNSLSEISAAVTLNEKGFAAAAIGYVNKDPKVITSDAEPLMTPLKRYEDIFLTHTNLNDDKIICINNNDKLSSEIIISV